jgi:protein TonB
MLLHAVFFLFLTLNSKAASSPAESPEPETAAFALVNISVPEPEPLPPPKPPPVPAVIPPEPPALAEIFIPVEEDTPPEGPPVPVETPAVSPPSVAAAVPAAAPARPAPEATDNAAAAAYARRNYTYIQRRIRDRLVYPSQARRAGIQGVAEIAFTIHEDGTVSGVTVLVSSGQESLDQAAIAAIHAAAPFPRPPAPARLSIPVAFRLR